MSINADGSRSLEDAVEHVASKAGEIRTLARENGYDPDTLAEALVSRATVPAEARDLEDLARHILRSTDREDPAVRVLAEKLADLLA